MAKEPRVAFLVNSCDAYSDLWAPFFSFFFKNWADCPFEIDLISNHKSFDHPRVRTIQVGDDVSYADNLRSALCEIEAEWILLWFDDTFIEKPVDSQRLIRILDYAEEQSTPLVQLFCELPLSYEESEQDIALLPEGVKYRSAVGANFIRKELLWELARPGMSAWDMDTSDLLEQQKIDVYALTKYAAKNPPIEYLHTVTRGKWVRDSYPKLVEAGLFDVLKGREIQPFWEHVYFLLYALRSDLYKHMSRYWY